MAEPITEHRDKLGRVLAVGEYVAFPQGNKLYFGLIVKINPKMVSISPVGAGWEAQKYSHDLLRVDGSDITFYLLKFS